LQVNFKTYKNDKNRNKRLWSNWTHLFQNNGRTNHKKFEVVAINDLIDANYMAYMLKYDSVFRRFNGTVEAKDGHLFVNGKKLE
jgi:hypothetical protein